MRCSISSAGCAGESTDARSLPAPRVRRVGEHDGAQPPPIDLAVLVQHRFAPAGDDPSRTVGLTQSGVAQLVAGDDARAVASEGGRYLALAAADAADQADHGLCGAHVAEPSCGFHRSVHV